MTGSAPCRILAWGCLLAAAAGCGRPAEVIQTAPNAADAGARILYQEDFETAPLGTIGEAVLSEHFRNPRGSIGVAAGRISVVDDDVGKVMRVRYPPDAWAATGGAIWRVELQDTVEEAWLSYRLRFAPDFDFVKGGKLPGLGGGAANTGGERPDGTDGWSARMMWRDGGRAVFYLYHPDQPNRFGEDLRWGSILRPVRFRPGAWHEVVHHVVLNTPGERDGRLQGWFDGELVADFEGIRFRDVDTFGIDVLLISTFFGGSGPEWAPDMEEHADFDDFRVWTRQPGDDDLVNR